MYPRQVIAIVGQSGCGKTTLAQLIAGNFRPTKGISYDGHDGDFISHQSLRRQIGFVMQTHHLFQVSIGDNIAYADDAPSQKRIAKVANQAHVAPFVTVLPAGYSTVLGEGGTGLSGGQAQRLSLARTLYRDPRILILDEATSELDADSEQSIVENMHELVRGRTSIIIAHRLSTIRRADVIFVMKEGEIVEEGNHEQLISSRGHYAELFAGQLTEFEN
ncbi:MAG: ATP-binding cassette domain-containing protein [Myxococcota bacterium]